MAIRFRKYRSPRAGEVTAIKLNEKNVEEVAAYINKNGGVAIDESRTFHHESFRDGVYTAVKLSLVQKNVGKDNKVRRGVRKAFAGDFVVRTEVKKGVYEFSRVRDAGVNDFVAV